MKLLGITMIFVAASATGFFAGERYLSVLKEIKRAESLIGSIILGLQSERMTLSEIFENAVFSGDEKTKLFTESLSFQSLDDASKIAEKCGFCKDKATNLILGEAFSVLGKYSAGEQINELEFCRNKLRALYEKSEEPFSMKAKLSRYSGILAGTFFVIILL